MYMTKNEKQLLMKEYRESPIFGTIIFYNSLSVIRLCVIVIFLSNCYELLQLASVNEMFGLPVSYQSSYLDYLKTSHLISIFLAILFAGTSLALKNTKNIYWEILNKSVNGYIKIMCLLCGIFVVFAVLIVLPKHEGLAMKLLINILTIVMYNYLVNRYASKIGDIYTEYYNDKVLMVMREKNYIQSKDYHEIYYDFPYLLGKISSFYPLQSILGTRVIEENNQKEEC